MAIVRRARTIVFSVGGALALVSAAVVSGVIWRGAVVGLGDCVWFALALLYIWFFFVGFARIYLRFRQNAARFAQGDQSIALPFALAREAVPLPLGETMTLRHALDRKGRRLHGVYWGLLVLVLLDSIFLLLRADISSNALRYIFLLPLFGDIFFGNFRLILPQTIQVDDVGVHIQRGRSLPQTLRWHEILGVVRVQLRTGVVQRDYRLITHERLVHLDFFADSSIFGRLLKKRVIYSGSDAGYQHDVERVLATLAERSSRPVEFPDRRKGQAPRLAKLTLADAQALPIAPPHLQPLQWVGMESPAAGLPLAFSSIPAWGQIWRRTLFALLLAGLVFGGAGLLAVLQDGGKVDVFILSLVAVLLLSIVLLIGLPLYLWGNLVMYRLRFPKLLATAEGLALHYRMVHLAPVGPVSAWSAFHAWVVSGAPDGRKTYSLYASDRVLSWSDAEHLALQGRGITGDRRLAYREKLAQLHALIAERTGLVLREET